MTGNGYTRYAATDVAEEALRYLDVVDVFATLNADPHAAARARAARARACEDRAVKRPEATERKGVLRWKS
jgi:putative ubiquitin-RnfH superfamily antitoxin RatB of RatAB toxin-antitoxin module